ncbi:MAG: hypothetical protein MHM6MM_001222 [Cercozoa sp. M6MM]
MHFLDLLGTLSWFVANVFVSVVGIMMPLRRAFLFVQAAEKELAMRSHSESEAAGETPSDLVGVLSHLPNRLRYEADYLISYFVVLALGVIVNTVIDAVFGFVWGFAELRALCVAVLVWNGGAQRLFHAALPWITANQHELQGHLALLEQHAASVATHLRQRSVDALSKNSARILASGARLLSDVKEAEMGREHPHQD